MSHANCPDHAVFTERRIAATPAEIFAAFQHANQLAEWWGPNGFTNTFDEFEFRPEGRWNFTMHSPNGSNFANISVFREIIPNRQIVLEHQVTPWFRLTITLIPEDEKTHLTWLQEFDNPTIARSMRVLSTTANEQVLDRLQATILAHRPNHVPT